MTMMKNKALVCLAAMAVLVLVFSAGCSAPGLTSSEVHRRHHHTVLNNWWQVQDDIDTVLLLDRPSRLSSMPVR
jgi:ABC-type oligopeptide transport system substrate-binding subunit